MVSWKLSLTLVVAVFLVLSFEVDARRRGNRRNNAVSSTEEDSDDTRADVGRRNRGDRRRNRQNRRNRNGRRGNNNNGDVGVGTNDDDMGEDETPSVNGEGDVFGNRGRRPGRRRGRGRNNGASRRRGGGRRNRNDRRRVDSRRRGNRGGRRRGPNEEQIARMHSAYVTSQSVFGVNMYKSMRSVGDNFVFSPLGCFTATAITMIAAKGRTKRQYRRNFSYPGHPVFRLYNETLTFGDSNAGSLLMPTGVFMRTDTFPVKEKFQEKLLEMYLTTVTSFETNSATDDVNTWMASRTDNAIPDFLDEGAIPDDFRFFLVNGLFFDRHWAVGFQEEDTIPRIFTTENFGEYEVETMSVIGNFRHKTSTDLGARVIELPYQGGKFAMYIFLPDPGNEIVDLENRMTVADINATLHTLEEAAGIEVRLPKFTLETHVFLKELLISLNISNVFNTDADLRHLTAANNVNLGDIIHRSKLTVDEGGPIPDVIEASVQFYATRPFLFLIRDRVKEINLLMGRFVNPVGNDVMPVFDMA